MVLAMQRLKQPNALPDRLGDPDACDVSFVVLFDGWLGDVERFHASVAGHVSGTWEIVVVDNPVDDVASQHLATLDRTLHLPLKERVGFGAGRNIGLRQATGRIVCIVDTSIELTGDVLAPLDRTLSDAAVGVVGRWGVVTDNGFDFTESVGPDVEGVEGYLMALRRADLPRVGLFDPKFRFYRNADLDFTYKVRDAGFRSIVDPSLSVVRHEHRAWTNTPDRDELSRKNFFRFRDHWGDRSDLFVSRR
jgi:cysteinyl-tRNA synthetase